MHVYQALSQLLLLKVLVTRLHQALPLPGVEAYHTQRNYHSYYNFSHVIISLASYITIIIHTMHTYQGRSQKFFYIEAGNKGCAQSAREFLATPP